MTYQPATRRLLLDDMETFTWNELLSEQTAEGDSFREYDPLLSLTLRHWHWQWKWKWKWKLELRGDYADKCTHNNYISKAPILVRLVCNIWTN
jgi:hypothetical protein